MADRLSPVTVSLVGVAVSCAAWGLLGTEPRPRDVRLLQERYAPDHVGDDAWELQLIDYSNALRPWNEGYAEARAGVRRVSRARRERVSWPPHEVVSP